MLSPQHFPQQHEAFSFFLPNILIILISRIDIFMPKPFGTIIAGLPRELYYKRSYKIEKITHNNYTCRTHGCEQRNQLRLDGLPEHNEGRQ